MFTISFRPSVLCIPTTFQAGKAFDRSGSVCVSQSQLGQRKVLPDKSVPLNLSLAWIFGIFEKLLTYNYFEVLYYVDKSFA